MKITSWFIRHRSLQTCILQNTRRYFEKCTVSMVLWNGMKVYEQQSCLVTDILPNSFMFCRNFFGWLISLIKNVLLHVWQWLSTTSKIHKMLCGHNADKFLLFLLFGSIITVTDKRVITIQYEKLIMKNIVLWYYTDSYPTEQTVTVKERKPSRDTHSCTSFIHTQKYHLPYNEPAESAVSCVRTERGGTLDKQNHADCWFCCIGEASE